VFKKDQVGVGSTALVEKVEVAGYTGGTSVDVIDSRSVTVEAASVVWQCWAAKGTEEEMFV
jgi:hypothetical protein